MRIADHTGEVSTIQYPGDPLLAGNIDQEFTDALALQTATMAVVLGKLLQTSHLAKISPHGVGAATDPNAQRESKALVQYYDDTTFERATLEIPCPDLAKQNPDYPGTFFLDGASNNHADWAAFVTAFETFVPGPGGNTSVVERITHVGRNL